LEYLSHPENYAKNHSDFIRGISIKSHEGSVITYEQEIGMMGRTMKQLQKMIVSPDGKNVQIDTIGGSGKGSRITMTISGIQSGGSQVKYLTEMELGILGFMAKGAAKSEMEKVANEDSKNLDAMS
jgi:hypothetical protein